MHLVFSLHDTAELEERISGAGFRDVAVRAGTSELRLPAPGELLWQHVRGTPLAALTLVADHAGGP